MGKKEAPPPIVRVSNGPYYCVLDERGDCTLEKILDGKAFAVGLFPVYPFLTSGAQWDAEPIGVVVVSGSVKHCKLSLAASGSPILAMGALLT